MTMTATTFPPSLAHAHADPLPEAALAQLFNEARTANGFTDRPVPDALLRQAYELARMAPTGMNSQPARYVFLKSPEARARLLPAMAGFNADKTRDAPVTIIVAADTRYHEHMPQIWHDASARESLAGDPDAAAVTAERNAWLGAAYFMLAARALGLDCGPMGGFDAKRVNAEFFSDGRLRAQLVINVGYGDPTKLFPRNGRLAFEQAVQVF